LQQICLNRNPSMLCMQLLTTLLLLLLLLLLAHLHPHLQM
jgi:hypothetical protein